MKSSTVAIVASVLLGAAYMPASHASQLTHIDNSQKRPTNDEPFPSTDGRYLAIESNRTGRQQIYIIGIGRTVVRRVTYDDGADDSPAWSHEGRLIAYVSLRHGFTGVYVIRPDGTHERRLAVGLDYFHPTWSSDDTWIMYNANSRARPGVYELWAMRPDGSGKHAITHDNLSETTYGSWSPDGKQIVFRRKFPPFRSQVFVADANGANQRNLSNTDTYDGWPSWSPDGKRIVFSSNRLEADRTSQRQEVFEMNADGSGVRLLARAGGRNVEARFSADGRFVYFSHCVPQSCQVYAVPS
jgi:TolB protein